MATIDTHTSPMQEHSMYNDEEFAELVQRLDVHCPVCHEDGHIPLSVTLTLTGGVGKMVGKCPRCGFSEEQYIGQNRPNASSV